LNRYLQEVLQAARDGAEWIHRLHLFCRRSAARAWPTLLASVLAEEETRLRSAGLQSVRWTADLPADLPLVDIDAGAMQTVVAELVKNAREAGKDEGPSPSPRGSES